MLLFFCLCSSSLNSARWVSFYRREMELQWSSNLSEALELVLGRTEFWTWVSHNLLPVPTVPSEQTSQIAFKEFVIRVGADEVLLPFCPRYANFVLLEQAGSPQGKTSCLLLFLCCLQSQYRDWHRGLKKHLTDSPRQPPFIRVSQNYVCPAWKPPISHRPCWPLFP